MRLRDLILAGLMVGLISLLYNWLTVSVLGLYPDLGDYDLDQFYGFIFVKGCVVGVILTWLFGSGYRRLSRHNDDGWDLALGIFYIVIYAIVALLSFSIGEFLFFGTAERLILILTVDGVVETFIATVPIRFIALE